MVNMTGWVMSHNEEGVIVFEKDGNKIEVRRNDGYRGITGFNCYVYKGNTLLDVYGSLEYAFASLSVQ